MDKNKQKTSNLNINAKREKRTTKNYMNPDHT